MLDSVGHGTASIQLILFGLVITQGTRKELKNCHACQASAKIQKTDKEKFK